MTSDVKTPEPLHDTIRAARNLRVGAGGVGSPLLGALAGDRALRDAVPHEVAASAASRRLAKRTEQRSRSEKLPTGTGQPGAAAACP